MREKACTTTDCLLRLLIIHIGVANSRDHASVSKVADCFLATFQLRSEGDLAQRAASRLEKFVDNLRLGGE